tara:strand:+ start:382 stop:618 length:237 start_codon:yes stop_codon:yes gene_type:complete
MSSYKSLAIVSAFGISGSALCYYYSKYQSKYELENENRKVNLFNLSDFLNQGLFVGIGLGCFYTGTPLFYSFLFKNKM